MARKYRILQMLSLVYKIVAVLVLIVGAATGLFLLTTPGIAGIDTATGRLITGAPMTGLGAIVMLGSVLVALSLYALAEMLNLFIDLEANTRATAQRLNRFLRDQSDKP